MLKFGKQSPFKLEWSKSLRVRVSLFVSCFPDSVNPLIKKELKEKQQNNWVTVII